MQVGRDTLRLALKQLTIEGLIGTADAGKRRPILVSSGSRTATKKTRPGIVNYLSPHRLTQMTETTLAELEMLRVQLAESHLQLEVVNGSVFGMKRPERRLKKLVEEKAADVWILHQSTQPIQRWFESNGTPCLLHGFPHLGIDLPFVDLDYLAVGRHAGGFLSGRGHEEIAFLPTKAPLSGLELAEQGLRSVVGDRLLVYVDPGDLIGLERQIDRLLELPEPPTAIVATRSRQVLTVLTHLAQLGLCVPRDMSLILLDYNPYLENVVPPVAGYQVDVIHAAKTLSRKVTELAGSGSTTRKIPPLMPNFVEGRSVAKL